MEDDPNSLALQKQRPCREDSSPSPSVCHRCKLAFISDCFIPNKTLPSIVWGLLFWLWHSNKITATRNQRKHHCNPICLEMMMVSVDCWNFPPEIFHCPHSESQTMYHYTHCHFWEPSPSDRASQRTPNRLNLLRTNAAGQRRKPVELQYIPTGVSDNNKSLILWLQMERRWKPQVC